MAVNILLSATLAFAAFASAYVGLPTYGPFLPGPGELQGKQIIAAAGRTPNETHTISLDNALGGSWRWSINITEIAIPDHLFTLGQADANYSSNFRFTNTEWQVQWPGSNLTLQEFLGAHNASAQINVLKVPLSNATNGNCSQTLGDQCASSVQSAARSNNPIHWDRLQGCGSISGVNGSGATFGLKPTSNVSFPITTDSSFFYFASDAYTAGDKSVFTAAVNAFNVLAIHFEPMQTGIEVPQPIEPIVLCQVVKAPQSQQTPPSAAFGSPQVAVVAWAVVVATAAMFLLR